MAPLATATVTATVTATATATVMACDRAHPQQRGVTNAHSQCRFTLVGLSLPSVHTWRQAHRWFRWSALTTHPWGKRLPGPDSGQYGPELAAHGIVAVVPAISPTETAGASCVAALHQSADPHPLEPAHVAVISSES